MKNKNLEISLNGSIIKAIITLTIPILLANLLQSAYQLTDAFWVGRLGGDAVASVSVSFPITFLIISLGSGFAIAGSTFIAQYAGAKNEKMVNHVAAQTLMMVVVVSLFFGSIGYSITPLLLKLMGVSQNVYNDALSFLRVSFVGIIFVFSFAMFQSIMRGLGEVKMPMKIVMLTVLLNFIVDPLFIYGYGFIKPMGVSGAAMATLFTQALATIIGLIVLLKGKYHIHLKLIDFKPDFSYIKKAFAVGFPSSIEMSARSFGMLVITFLIASFGTQAVASYGAGSNIIQLVMIPAMGFMMSTSVLVGQNIGAKNLHRAEEIAKVSSIISFSTLFILGIITFFTAPYLIRFFIPNDEAIINGGAIFLKTISLSFGFIGLQFAITGIFRAAGNMKTTLVITLISQWLIQLPIAFILSKYTYLEINGVWFSFFITNLLTAVIGIYWFRKGYWKTAKLTENEKLKEKVSKDVIIEEGVR